jgi:N-acetylglucosamine-6-phosphate deacetylase
MEAFHVEGPHISPEDGPRGAHQQRWVRPPDVNEFCAGRKPRRVMYGLVTLSPEWPGAPLYIEALASEGVVTSIGHTRATREQIQDAVSAGATLSTHIGNGAHACAAAPPLTTFGSSSPKDRLAASFIVDGIHLGEAFLRVALRAKGNRTQCSS